MVIAVVVKLTCHTMDWESATAPTLEEFEQMARAAFARLPAAFRAMCGDVLIRIADYADEETLKSVDLEHPYQLLGLYHGVDLSQKSVLDSGQMPDMVFLYRRAILDVWADGEETLGHIISHVLIHELGHHFGLSDEAMHALEEQAAREEGTGRR
jgi:predicted Zn-dependent protease with MMP-like domain